MVVECSAWLQLVFFPARLINLRDTKKTEGRYSPSIIINLLLTDNKSLINQAREDLLLTKLARTVLGEYYTTEESFEGFSQIPCNIMWKMLSRSYSVFPPLELVHHHSSCFWKFLIQGWNRVSQSQPSILEFYDEIFERFRPRPPS